MSKRIFKYPIDVQKSEQVINMPLGFEILTIQKQHGTPCIWAIVDDKEKLIVPVRIVRLHTGDEVSQMLKYIGTCVIANDNYVVHFFEDTPF